MIGVVILAKIDVRSWVLVGTKKILDNKSEHRTPIFLSDVYLNMKYFDS